MNNINKKFFVLIVLGRLSPGVVFGIGIIKLERL